MLNVGIRETYAINLDKVFKLDQHRRICQGYLSNLSQFFYKPLSSFSHMTDRESKESEEWMQAYKEISKLTGLRLEDTINHWYGFREIARLQEDVDVYSSKNVKMILEEKKKLKGLL